MFIGILNELPQMILGLAYTILVVIVVRSTILWPVIGSSKIRRMVGK